jgi:hypothetical protein
MGNSEDGRGKIPLWLDCDPGKNATLGIYLRSADSHTGHDVSRRNESVRTADGLTKL